MSRIIQKLPLKSSGCHLSVHGFLCAILNTRFAQATKDTTLRVLGDLVSEFGCGFAALSSFAVSSCSQPKT